MTILDRPVTDEYQMMDLDQQLAQLLGTMTLQNSWVKPVDVVSLFPLTNLPI